MRTPEELVTLVTLAAAAACAASTRGAARDLRHVHEAAAEPELPPWPSAPPLAYEPNSLSLRRFDALVSFDYEPRRQPFYRIRQVFGDPFVASNSAPAVARTRIADGLLTFGAQTPDPRLQRAIQILIVRQLPVDAFFDGSQPPPPPPPPAPSGAERGPATLAAGLLTFGATAPPPPSATPTPPPLAWWRSPPPVQVAVRPRLAEAAAETLAVGSSPLVARLHGPIAMGSGGVGYARLADGRLAIGSGSIGFAQFDVLSVGSYL